MEVSRYAPDSQTSTDNYEASTAIQCPPSIHEKALIRKIDGRVLPVLFIIYLAAFLDRYVEMPIFIRLIITDALPESTLAMP